MTPAERRAYYHRLLDHHNRAFQAFRDASHAFDRAMEAMHEVMASIRQSNEAEGRAIEAMMAANRDALALLNADEEGSR